jgi:hypothetical protein
MNYKFITPEVLADSFGISVDDLTNKSLKLLNDMNTKYTIISGEERDRLLVDIINKIESDTQVIGAPDRTKRWFDGWKENLDDFQNSEFNLDTLMPKFIRKNQPIRFMGEYVHTAEEHFEHVYFDIFRTWLFEKYFESYSTIYDIGCGSSYNLIKLCEMYPDKKVYGFDFVQSSVDIVTGLANNHGLNAEGSLFNIIEPDFNITIDEDSLIFTSGVIEQIASRFDKFIDFLLQKKPKLVVHVEPTYEVYNQEILFDNIAAKFHDKRGYTKGYLPRLQELERENKIEILKIKRLNFGSLFMEGYTNIIWRPL